MSKNSFTLLETKEYGRKQKFLTGFTLIELIVVIAIIAILAAIIAPNAFKAIEKAKIAEVIGDHKTYKTSIYALYADTGHWVTDVNGYFRFGPDNNDLIKNLHGWSGWDGPYVEKIKSQHPWSGSYYVGDSRSVSWYPPNCIILEIEDVCYPSGPNGGCPMPDDSAQRMDSMVDDGDLSTGKFFGGSDRHYYLLER